MKEIVIPFTLTAAQVNTLDTVKTTIVTFSSDAYIRIPKRLMLKKAAGTAYALTQGNDSRVGIIEGDAVESYADAFAGGATLQVIETQSAQTIEGKGLSGGRVVFSVPEEGFLDSTSAQVRIAIPSSRARVFRDAPSSFVINSTASIASGTGGLEGWLVFEEYVPGA